MKTPRPTKNAERGAPTKRQFTDITGLLALHSTINGAWCASPTTLLRGTIRTKAKAPVPEKHLWFSGCSPHRQAGFCFVQILGTGAPALAPHSFGRDGPTRKDGRTAEPVFFTSRPPTALKTQTVVLKSRSGAKTMCPSPVASRCAAPTTTPTTSEQQAFALLQATSDAAMAKLYLSRGNIPAARRKAVQLLKALQVMEVAA